MLAQLRQLDEQCAALMQTDGIALGATRIHYWADVCYVGQSFYLEVAIDAADPDRLLDRLYGDFIAAHERIYGHATQGPARIVNLRSVHRAGGEPEPAVNVEPHDRNAPVATTASPKASRRLLLLPDVAGHVTADVYDRDELRADAEIAGPAIIEQTDTTTLVLPGWRARRVDSGDLLMEKMTSA